MSQPREVEVERSRRLHCDKLKNDKGCAYPSEKAVVNRDQKMLTQLDVLQSLGLQSFGVSFTHSRGVLKCLSILQRIKAARCDTEKNEKNQPEMAHHLSISFRPSSICTFQ